MSHRHHRRPDPGRELRAAELRARVEAAMQRRAEVFARMRNTVAWNEIAWPKILADNIIAAAAEPYTRSVGYTIDSERVLLVQSRVLALDHGFDAA